MTQQKIFELFNTMTSNSFDLYHVKDVVDENATLYHHHDFYEIHCTLQGSGTFFINGREFQLTAGSIVLIQPNTLHRIINQTSDFFERIYLFIDPTFLKSLSTKKSKLESCFETNNQLTSRIIEMPLQDLQKYLRNLELPMEQTFGKDIEYQFKLTSFLIAINKLILEKEEDNPLPKISDTPNELILRTMDYVDEHLVEDLSLKNVASQLFVDHYHLSREFKKFTDMNFHSYVVKKRLLYSKKLLLIHRNANQVFLQCGFKSYTHFLRCFKNEFSMTPKEFLKKETIKQTFLV